MRKAKLITSPENMRYISGFTGEGAVFLFEDEKIIFTDGRYTIQAEHEAPDFKIITTNHYLDEIKKFRVKKIYIEQDKISLSELARMRATLPLVRWDDLDQELKQMRIIKTAEEIESIAHAADIANRGFEHIKDYIKAGMSEKEAALELEFFMRKSGADGLSFDTILASGANSAMAHAKVTEDLIPDNSYVLIDFGCKYKGYCSDMTRMVKVGTPSDEMQKIYDIVLQAQSAGLAAIHEGVLASDVDKAARDIIEAAGYGETFIHSTGHGVGLDIHEDPHISRNSETILQEGMVITVEPGIYVEGLGGVRIEDMVIVTKDGYRDFSIKDK